MADFGIPVQLRGTTDPYVWAGAFLARQSFSEDAAHETVAAWFRAALETGRHYGAKAAQAAEVPELTADQMRAIELEHLEYTDKHGGIMSQALRARLWTLRAEQHG